MGRRKKDATTEALVPAGTIAVVGGVPKTSANYVNSFNHCAKKCGWPRCLKFTDERARKLAARVRDKDFDWKIILSAAMASDGLFGQQWFNIDFLLRNGTNWVRVVEGAYRHELGRKPVDPLEENNRRERARIAEERSRAAGNGRGPALLPQPVVEELGVGAADDDDVHEGAEGAE